ncbi:MAG: TIGR00269 family protein [Candidatus Heimdallarchaeota archaeon]
MIAVSGGADSVCLLHVLKNIETKYPKVELIAVTIDEGIVGYRDGALKLAQENAKRVGVDFSVVSFKELYTASLDELVTNSAGKKGALKPCSICGILRRKAINIAAQELEADRVATGHNLDDEAQTVLLNLLRGDILHLARLNTPIQKHKKLIPRVKPLENIPEPEIPLFLYVNEIRYHTFRCPYAEDAMRTDIRQFLYRQEQKHPGTLHGILRSFEKIQPVLQQSMGAEEIRLCKICSEPSVSEICKACQILEKENFA